MKIFEKLFKPLEPINNEFRICRDDFWWFNKEWDLPIFPDFKIGFSFNDPEEVSGCPFVCKIGKNTNGKYKYFGMVYGNSRVEKYSKEKLINFTNKFSSREIFDKLNKDGVAVN